MGVSTIEKRKRSLPDTELGHLIASFNQTKCEYPSDQTISLLFEKQAAKTPHRIAAAFQGSSMTYAQINAKANQLARKLRKMGIGADDYVGILAERGVEMLVAMFGVLKAGGAYVPLDPAYPNERLAFMLNDCSAKALLLFKTSCKTDIPIIDLKDVLYWQEEDKNLSCINQPSDVAYLIYTSGTTGTPKAIMIEHRNVLNYCTQNGLGVMRYANNLNSILSVTNLGFDIFVTETILALLSGMTIYIADAEEQTDAEAFLRLEAMCKAEILQTTPSRLQMYLAQNSTHEAYRHLKYIMIGGEAVPQNLVERLKIACPQARIIDVYGPSETTVWSTCADVTEREVTIGKPISNTQIYILNQNELCPIGEIGELCIAGDGLARGYLNREELTKEKFVDNPFGEGRMYRTGDLAKWMPDGNIAFMGRADEQVKIRGFRIELGEIENVLRKILSIKDCALIAREDHAGEKAIFAYLVSDEQIDISKVRETLSRQLPTYMVPTYMTQIGEIPVTRNGKLDKKALPQIEQVSVSTYSAPKNQSEKEICEAFSEILGVEKIGAEDSFFDLGGHSLRVMKLINRLQGLIGRRLTQAEIFNNPTPRTLALMTDEQVEPVQDDIPQAQTQESYSMSAAQQRIYLACQMGENNTSYNLPTAWRLSGAVDIEKLRFAYNQMLKRHEILRTEFFLSDGEGRQRVLPDVQDNFEYLDDEITVQEDLIAEFVRVFNLSKAPLVRMKLIKRKNHYLLLMDFHHIISDGMSEEIFLKELAALYNGETLPAVKRQYKDYSEWMRGRKIDNSYWLEQFSDTIPLLDMPLDYKRPLKHSHRGAMLTMPLHNTLCQQIGAMSRKHGATPYMIFLSAAMILLSKYSRQEDIVIGGAFSGRTNEATEHMLGMFVNTLAMRAQPEANKTYATFLQEIKYGCLRAHENQEYPFEQLVQTLGIRRDVSRNPLFDVMLVLQNHDHTNFSLRGIDVSKLQKADTGATFDLTFNIEEENGSYSIGLEYCTDLFRRDTARRMLEHLIAILWQLKDGNKKLCEISTVTESERALIMNEFNETAAPYPRDATIPMLFELQARKTPQNIAVVCNEQSITYGELNEKANQLAHKLREIGIQPNDFVAVLTRRSIEMIIAVYGVLKSGAAYVPMDPTYPKERLQFMLEDCRPKAVLTYQTTLQTDLPTIDLADKMLWDGDTNDPLPVNQPTDLAYCIYTSGTTGKPKGVLVEHHGIANLKAYFVDRFGVCEDDRVLQFANLVFDGSVWEMNMALLNGARLIISTNNLDIPAFEEMFIKQGVTIASLPPNFYVQLGDVQPRILITAGSASDHGVLEKAKGMRYVNSYGPTECTVAATHWEGSADAATISIGKPIQNVQVYILQGSQLCGVGVPGELCISGAGVARGYLNRSELNTEKFVEHPFGAGKLYRTGDLARWLPDGNIEFLGRVDEQVKIRGFRVELGEIEHVLRKVESIKDCAVVVRKDSHGEDAIYAYVVTTQTADFDTIRSEIKKSLPDYMIPTYMMQLPSIPVTRNGKLDKQALPEIELRSDSEYIPPRNTAEMLLCEAFQEILNVSCVSVKDNFFDFGGDSIKAIRVVSKLREKGYTLSVKDIMENAIVEEIAMFARLQQQSTYDQSEAVGNVVDTPMLRQFRQWNLAKPNHFNQAVMFPLDADENQIASALDALAAHHDVLRAVWRDDRLKILSCAESKKFDFTIHDLSSETDVSAVMEHLCNQIQGSIDLQNGPLMKAALFRLAKVKYLFICIHHLAVDGISWQILLDDFDQAIEQQMRGENIKLPLKTASFQAWAESLNEYAESDLLKTEAPYWQEICCQVPQCGLELKRQHVDYTASAMVSFSKEETERLLLDAGKAYNTQINDLLLSALAMTVGEITRQKKIAVCLEGHGRETIHKEIDIDRTVGWFTCAYPVILDCAEDVESAVIQTKEMLRKIPNHGLGYSLLPDLERSAKVDVYFNYLGETKESCLDKTNSCGIAVAEENRFAGEINFNGGVSDGILTFEISCNQATFDENTAMLFAKQFQMKLIQIIDFCASSGESQKTLADVDADDLDEADFDEINAILGLF